MSSHITLKEKICALLRAEVHPRSYVLGAAALDKNAPMGQKKLKVKQTPASNTETDRSSLIHCLSKLLSCDKLHVTACPSPSPQRQQA